MSTLCQPSENCRPNAGTPKKGAQIDLEDLGLAANIPAAEKNHTLTVSLTDGTLKGSATEGDLLPYICKADASGDMSHNDPSEMEAGNSEISMAGEEPDSDSGSLEDSSSGHEDLGSEQREEAVGESPNNSDQTSEQVKFE